MQTRQKIISGKTYAVRPMLARDMHYCAPRLMAWLGPVFIKLSEKDSMKMDVKDLADPFVKFCDALSSDDAWAVIERLMKCVDLVGLDTQDPIDRAFNALFAGDPKAFYSVLWFAVEVNFISFFPDSLLSKMKEAAAKAVTQTATAQSKTATVSGEPQPMTT